MNHELDTVCRICGDFKTWHYNHDECAKVRKELYSDKNKKRKSAPKKLNKKSCDEYGKICSNIYT